MFKNITITVLVLSLSACSSLNRFTEEEQNSRAYSSKEVGQFSTVIEGTIVSIKKVKLSGSKVLGTTFGGVLGGIAGASTTNKKHNQSAAIAIGALAGAILGSAVEKFSTEDIGYEILIKTDNGLKAFVDTTKQDLKVGDKVYITHGSGPVRISRQ